MRVVFIGVGEAFDEHYPNTSVLISLDGSHNSGHILLDCGFTAAAAYYVHSSVGAALDAVWVSHFHGDHFLGLPLLLLRFWEEGRTKPLTVVGQEGVKEKIWFALDLAYPGFRQRLQYPVHFIEVGAGEEIDLLGAHLSCAATDHSISAPCLSLRLDHEGKSVFYSGDGRPTEATADLAQGVSLLIHEAYGFQSDTPGHGGIQGCIDLARTVTAQNLALVHLNQRFRRESAAAVRDILTREFSARGMLPEPGYIIDV